MRPAFQYDFVNFPPVFEKFASAKRVADSLGVRIWEVRPGFRKQGRTFLLNAKFQHSRQMLARGSSSKLSQIGR